MSSKMDQNFKVVIKTFSALLLLSLAWLTGYLLGKEANPAINNPVKAPAAEILMPTGIPDIPPLINAGSSAKQKMPTPPPIIK